MFVSPLAATQKELSAPQKKALVILAYQLSVADGTVTPEEDVSLETVEAEIGMDIEVKPQELYERPDTSVFDTPRIRRIVMLELMCLAFADKHYHPDESTVLADLAQSFRIGHERLRAMEEWARRQVALLVEAQDLIDE